MKTKMVKQTVEKTVDVDGKEVQTVIGYDVNIFDDNDNYVGAVNNNRNGGNFWLNEPIDVVSVTDALVNLLTKKK